MSDILSSVENFLSEYKIEGKILCAISGGADSVCLLHVLKSLGCNVVAIHLNHNFRCEESDRDEKFVKEFSNSLGVEFYSEKLPDGVVPTEENARNLRYDFFENCSKKFSSNFIFLAHNKNDVAENVIYRMAKGAGLKGLSSIGQVRDIFYRPLLSFSRDEIEQYLKTNSLPCVFDSSNDDVNYKRNFIRKEILPKLLEINPNVVNNLYTNSLLIKSQYEIVQEALGRAKSEVITGDKIILKEFLAQSNAMQLEILNDYLSSDLKYRDYKRVKMYLDFIKSDKKRISLNSDLFLEKSKEFIYKKEVKKEEG